MRLLKLTLRAFLPRFGNTILLLVLGCLLRMFNKLSLADVNHAFPFFDALIVVFFLFGAPRNNEFAHLL